MLSPDTRPSRAPAPDRFRRLESDRYDVVVVGAGLGGLTAAALLARRGISVLVVDQHYVAGGCATVFRRPGYEFDVGLHYVGDCAPGGPIPRFLAEAGVEDVEFLPMDESGFDVFRFPDGFTFAYPRGFDALEQRLLEVFPAEAKGVKRYMKALRQMRLLAEAEGRAWPLMKAIPRALLAASCASMTLERFLDTCTKNPRLRAILVGPHLDYAVAPSRVSLPLHLGLVGHYVANGAWYPKGGGQALADKLAARVESYGAKILLRARAERIIVERGRVTGVELYNKHTGRRRVGASLVISDADIKQTFATLLPPDAVRQRTLERVRRFEMAPAIAVLYLGVRRDALPAELTNANQWLFASDDQESPYSAVRAGEFSACPPAYVTITSLKEPERPIAPDGVLNLQIMTLAPSAPEAWGTTASALADGSYRRSEAYEAKKKALADVLRAQLESLWPGVGAGIVYEEMATPLTHHRYTLASEGTSYGIAATVAQFMGGRPAAKTELRGLVLAGASTRSGHGIVGAMSSGREAARVAGRALGRLVASRRSGY